MQEGGAGTHHLPFARWSQELGDDAMLGLQVEDKHGTLQQQQIHDELLVRSPSSSSAAAAGGLLCGEDFIPTDQLLSAGSN